MNRVKSPCIEYCKLNDEGVCIGCGRTADEIARYMRASESERESINERAHERLSKVYSQE